MLAELVNRRVDVKRLDCWQPANVGDNESQEVGSVLEA